MSSRALRKLQREEEDKRNQLQVSQEREEDDDESEDDLTPPPKAMNAFNMLNADDEDDEYEAPRDDSQDDDALQAKMGLNSAVPPTVSAAKSGKSKKKKKKNKSKGHGQTASGAEVTQPSEKDPPLDEIDLALKSLSTKCPAGSDSIAKHVPLKDPAHERLNSLLAVESKHLNALNEMKRLFGNVVLENEDESPGTPRRRGRGPRQLDLGAALAAENSPVARGQGLAGIALRRNFLIQGKAEWPKAAGGGLGMELVERLDDGTIEYRFVHNTVYQDVQRQFMSCVESMDPQRMISMLVYNPYHVSTILQVSEIAKQQGDHSVSGDLLERALFTFGRSVNASFTNALSEGKARLNFERPENREFWLAAWRYMNNLGQRGTWRTAYEWAKLILSLDPELDPYCIHKMMDQLALRGGQVEHFYELSECSSLWYGEDIWQRAPNVAISAALIENRLKRPQQCRTKLKRSIELYPWIFARLFQELNIDHIPRSIWAKTPRTPRERLDCESYVMMAKDLWNTPEATSLLVEVASYAEPPPSPTVDSRPITIDEARHAVLSGIPAVIDCIPRSFTSQSTSSFDPFPPIENLPSYDPSPNAAAGHYHARGGPFDPDDEDDSDDPPVPPNLDHLEVDPATAQRTDVRGLQSFFSRFIPWLSRSEANTGENNESTAPGPSSEMEAAIAASAREAHAAELPAAEIEERGARLLEALEQANPAMNLIGQGPDEDERHMEPSEGVAQLLARAHELGIAMDGRIVRQTARVGEDDHNDDDNDEHVPTHRAILETGEVPNITEPASTTPHQQQSHQPSVSDAPDDDDNETNITADSSTTSHRHQATSPPQPYNDDHNQRWLAGQGMLALKADYAAHPSHFSPHNTSNDDDDDDDDDSDENTDKEPHPLLTTYATRILALRGEKSRRFILDYALRQGAGAAVGDAVEREVARLKTAS